MSGRWERRTPGLRGEREKVKLGVATPRDLLECGWGGVRVVSALAPNHRRRRRRWKKRAALRKYKNEVVKLRFPSDQPREPRSGPQAAAGPRRGRPAPGSSPHRARSSRRNHGAGASVSTMELAAWCRWALLLALLPPGAAGTQGGSGMGGAT